MQQQTPLYDTYPSLRAVPRVLLCTLPSPVQLATVSGTDVWIKRDGLNSEFCGGNKARSLEFLLAGVEPGDTLVTAGGEGSTHVLATAVHARRLGARVIGVRWRHEMNPSAQRIAERISDECVAFPVYRNAVIALARAQVTRLLQHARYIPVGGSTPIGVLAHVNAALELANQIRAGELPFPARVVVPLGSGGTVAGLSLGFAVAGLETATIAVQVTPAIVANRFRVSRLISATARLIARLTGERVPSVPTHLLGIVRDAYGGAYGRVVPAATAAARELASVSDIRLDDTYSGKAFVVARELARHAEGPTLFWDTFDSRLL
ncbi:MAG: pyridoxal-phosphate dependent enzyme [Gemmatimonadaceae bacterium]